MKGQWTEAGWIAAAVMGAVLAATPLEGQSVGPAGAPQAVTAWIEANAIPLSGDDPTLGGADLVRWRSLAGGARIVGLGEGTHGTREFYRLKHRLVRGLADSLDAVLWETNVADGFVIERLLTDPDGGGEAADEAVSMLRGFNWETREVRDFFAWMAVRNASAPDPLRFVAIDIFGVGPAFVLAREALRRADPAAATSFDSVAVGILGREQAALGDPDAVVSAIGDLNLADYRRWAEAAALLHRLLAESEAPWEARLAARTVEQRARHLLQFFALVPDVGTARASDVFGAFRSAMSTAADDAAAIRALLDEHDPEFLAAVSSTFDELADPRGALGVYAGLTPGQRYDRVSAVDRTAARLNVYRARYLKNGAEPTPIDAAADAVMRLRVLLDAFHEVQRIVPEREIRNLREISLAQNAQTVVRALGAETGGVTRAVFSAHNFHVNEATGPEGGVTAGGLLADALGDEYLSVGMFFGTGSFQARDLRSARDGWTGPRVRAFEVGPPPPGSLEAALMDVDLEMFMLDLRELPSGGVVADWFGAARMVRHVGNAYDPDAADRFFYETGVAGQFDVIVFVRRTERARPTDAAIRNGTYDVAAGEP